MAELLILGDFVFLDTEIPSYIPFGGKQMLSMHKMVGGQRQIDSMGEDPGDYTWTGRFFGENAMERARFVDTMRKSGNAFVLSYYQFRYEVKIRSFVPHFEAPFNIPYTLTVSVQKDLTNPITVIPVASFDQEIDDALFQSYNLGILISNDPISAALAALNIATENLDFDNATVLEINNAIAVAQTARNVTFSQIALITRKIFG